jgi:superfamily II DNA or RNA helicase
VKNQAALGDSTCRRILTLHTERLRLFETSDPDSPKGDAILEWADAKSPCLIMCRYRDVAQSVSEMIRGRLSVERADGSMSRPDIGAATEWFRSLRGGKRSSLVITRELGGRGLDFPTAASACLISPRSNHQAVAQEFARIRSRTSDPKEVLVLYFQQTEEEAKARPRRPPKARTLRQQPTVHRRRRTSRAVRPRVVRKPQPPERGGALAPGDESDQASI